MNSYNPGAPVGVWGTFRDYGGTLQDPTVITLYVYPPAQSNGARPGSLEYTYSSGSITRAAQGSYSFSFNPLPTGTPGIWQYTWVGTGALNTSMSGAFNVRGRPS